MKLISRPLRLGLWTKRRRVTLTPSLFAFETQTRRDSTKKIPISVKRLILSFSKYTLEINNRPARLIINLFPGFPASLACSLILTLLLGGVQVRIHQSTEIISYYHHTPGASSAPHHHPPPLVSHCLHLDRCHSHATPGC